MVGGPFSSDQEDFAFKGARRPLTAKDFPDLIEYFWPSNIRSR